jgi:hypothetical protein
MTGGARWGIVDSASFSRLNDVCIWGIARSQEEIQRGMAGMDYGDYPPSSSDLLRCTVMTGGPTPGQPFTNSCVTNCRRPPRAVEAAVA